MLKLPPISLYVHLPWCEKKCPYCDFNSHVAGASAPFSAYCTRLLEDLELELEWLQGRALGSIFIGGGTPSLFPSDDMARLLEGVRARLPLDRDAEITLEANPGSSDAAKFSAFRAAGINRLSIGVQSFDDGCLRSLGRIHDASAAHAAVESAQRAGFDNINVDLMHGLPGQDPRAALADIAAALSHGIEHLSWYQLTIERNTHFHSDPPELPPEEILAEIQAQGEEAIAASGLAQYEVSAFARPGRSSRHNLNYWNFGDYLAIGAGAHGKITLPDQGRVIRTQRTRVPRDYLQGDVSAGRQILPVKPDELALEYLMNALRLREGSPHAQFEERGGRIPAAVQKELQWLRDQGLIEPDPDWLRASPLGFRHLDAVLARFA